MLLKKMKLIIFVFGKEVFQEVSLKSHEGLQAFFLVPLGLPLHLRLMILRLSLHEGLKTHLLFCKLTLQSA